MLQKHLECNSMFNNVDEVLKGFPKFMIPIVLFKKFRSFMPPVKAINPFSC